MYDVVVVGAGHAGIEACLAASRMNKKTAIVTLSKDMIGSNALDTVKRESDAIDKDLKESMPKDAYAMWNKLNKSLIGFDEDKWKRYIDEK